MLLNSCFYTDTLCSILMWKCVARTCFYQLLHFFEEVLTDRPSINESTLDPDCTSPEAAAVSQLNPEMLNCIPTSTTNDTLHRVTFLCVDPALLVWIVRLIEVVPEVPTIPHSWKGNLDCVSFIYKTRRNGYPMESHYKLSVSSSSITVYQVQHSKDPFFWSGGWFCVTTSTSHF